jgi:hypothetical protein
MARALFSADDIDFLTAQLGPDVVAEVLPSGPTPNAAGAHALIDLLADVLLAEGLDAHHEPNTLGERVEGLINKCMKVVGKTARKAARTR